jgi:hypothetical protein
VDDAGACIGFSFSYGLLEQGTFYRVTIPSTVTSVSGAPLTRLNQANAYAFTFRTREDASVCRVERVGVQPENKVAHAIGERVMYSAEAFGAPDSCSVAGQRLEPMSYSWEWQHPIDDENNDRNQNTRVASWVNDGQWRSGRSV